MLYTFKKGGTLEDEVVDASSFRIVQKILPFMFP